MVKQTIVILYTRFLSGDLQLCGSDWAEEQQRARVFALTLHLSPDTRLVDILASPPVAKSSIGVNSIYTAAEFTCKPPRGHPFQEDQSLADQCAPAVLDQNSPKTNHTGRLNAPGFPSAALNTAGVNGTFERLLPQRPRALQ